MVTMEHRDFLNDEVSHQSERGISSNLSSGAVAARQTERGGSPTFIRSQHNMMWLQVEASRCFHFHLPLSYGILPLPPTTTSAQIHRTVVLSNYGTLLVIG